MFHSTLRRWPQGATAPATALTCGLDLGGHCGWGLPPKPLPGPLQVLIPVFALGRAQELCILLETFW